MNDLIPLSYPLPTLNGINHFVGDEHNIITSKGVNLRPLKIAIALLPDYASINDESSWLLEQIQAIVFHTSSPLNRRIVEDFFDENYIPTREKPLTHVEVTEANQLLLSLGLPTKVHSSVSGKLTRRI